MKKINFITTNGGKVISLKNSFKEHNFDNIEVVQQILDIVEPQANKVAEVSKNKALQAYKILREPILVEDGGFCIDALKGFPGVYTKYILETIGVDGLLKLMEGEKNRSCGFVSCITYIDENGDIIQFESNENDLAELTCEKTCIDCSEAWSDIWHVYKYKKSGKTLAEISLEKTEETNCHKRRNIDDFVEWFAKRYN